MALVYALAAGLIVQALAGSGSTTVQQNIDLSIAGIVLSSIAIVALIILFAAKMYQDRQKAKRDRRRHEVLYDVGELETPGSPPRY